MWFCLTTVLVILVALTKWEFRKAGLYLKLDADVKMCNLLDSPSLHACVWRPLDFRAPLRWKQANLVKYINTCLHHGKFVQSHLSYDATKQSWCKVKFASTHDGIPVLHVYIMWRLCKGRVFDKIWWNFHTIEVHNCNPRQKTNHCSITTAGACNSQLCDEKSNGRCQASLWPGSGSDMLKGQFTRAKQLQADLYNRTATQYM